jgi:hypothetical protein
MSTVGAPAGGPPVNHDDLPSDAGGAGSSGTGASGSTASTIMATVASPNPPMLATACAMSWWLALSYGGKGHPVVHGTAPETAANGAATTRATTARIPASRSSRSRSWRHPIAAHRRELT